MLRWAKPVVLTGDDERLNTMGDLYNKALNTLADLHDVIMAELPEVMK